MKYQSIVASFILAIYFFPAAAKNQESFSTQSRERIKCDTILPILSQMDVNSFVNKPIDSFLAKIPSGYLRLKIQSPGNPKYAEVLSVLYPGKVFIYIYVYEFTHMNPRSETFTWDMTLFRKEKISRIEIYNGVECIKGCP